MTARFRITYYVETPIDIIHAAELLANEQSLSHWRFAENAERERQVIASHAATVERVLCLPESLPVRLLTHVAPGRFGMEGPVTAGLVVVSYPWENGDGSITNVLNMAWGEPHHLGCFTAIKVIDMEFPPMALSILGGPRFGVPGIRALLQIKNRPLLCAPVKPPVGITPDEFAELAGQAYRGGADIVKDDELYVLKGEQELIDRVRLTVEARKRAEDATGEAKAYFVNVISDLSRSLRMAERALELGATGLMVAPGVMGFGVLGAFREAFGVPICSHNICLTIWSRSPAYGVDYSCLVALQRVAGADFVITPSPWGTFSMSYQDHQRNCQSALGPLENIKPTLLGFSGGKSVLSVEPILQSMSKSEYALVVGDALFNHPHGAEAGASALRAAIEGGIEGIALQNLAENNAYVKEALDRCFVTPRGTT
jgi:ribulose 1,5-bisphosphate carboxylase large subunit-like protein